MLNDFKAFIMKGNVVDLAVGVIIGGAFGKIVTSLVNDIIMPLVGLAMGGISFTDRFHALDGGTYATVEAAKEAGSAILAYGSLIQNVLDFLIVAACIFVGIKAISSVFS